MGFRVGPGSVGPGTDGPGSVVIPYSVVVMCYETFDE